MITLNISQTYGKIGMDSQNASLELRTTPAALEMHSEPARVDITQGKTEVLIDLTAFRYSYGMKNNSDFMRDYADEGKQAALEAIGATAEAGDQLANIGSRGNAIAALAQQATQQTPVDIEWAHLASPEFTVQRTPAQITATSGQVNIHYLPGRVDGDFHRGTVQIYLAQQPALRMWTTGSVDMMI